MPSISYKLDVTQEEFLLLFNTLSEVPARQSRMLLNSLQAQVEKQDMDIQAVQKEAIIEEAKRANRLVIEAQRRAALPEAETPKIIRPELPGPKVEVDPKTNPQDARYADAATKK
jgi:hypothetical protein